MPIKWQRDRHTYTRESQLWKTKIYEIFSKNIWVIWPYMGGVFLERDKLHM